MSVTCNCSTKVNLSEVSEKISKVVFRPKHCCSKKPVVIYWHDKNLEYLTSWIILLGWEMVEMNLICIWPQKTPFYIVYFKMNALDPFGYFKTDVNWKETNSVRNFLNSLLTSKA